MKKLLFILTLVASLTALPPLAGAKDKDKDKDKDHSSERDKKAWKDLRNEVRELREQYGRLVDTVNLGGVGRRTRDKVNAIGGDVQRTSDQFDHGNYDYGDLHNRVGRLMDAISRTRDQIKYDNQNQNRPRYYYPR